MSIVRRLFVLPLAALLAFSSTAAAAGQHVVPPSQVAAALADHVAKQDADRTAVREALARPEVERMATTIGLDLARAKAAVEKIRARGGEVVFVRPPSAPELRVNEEAQVPKAKGWDVLLRNTKSVGIHIDDLPAAQGLPLPEWSHLSRKCATVFTDIYVRRLTELTPRFKLRGDAPPPLSRADCVPAA